VVEEKPVPSPIPEPQINSLTCIHPNRSIPLTTLILQDHFLLLRSALNTKVEVLVNDFTVAFSQEQQLLSQVYCHFHSLSMVNLRKLFPYMQFFLQIPTGVL